MDGYGKLYYPNLKLAYEGEWKNNAFNGKGKVYNEDP
jgi:antitoxin component YwqK of YwqJK toxin-antitoxin module